MKFYGLITGCLLAGCLLELAGCTRGECLRHSDCPREWRCRRSLCIAPAAASGGSNAGGGANQGATDGGSNPDDPEVPFDAGADAATP